MAKRDDPIDTLFKLPLSEFIDARKELAARLKKNGYADEAQRVKTLAKPPVSAWTVNQLFWDHREAFDELIATGQRLRKAQTSGKVANMREAVDARRDAISHLSHLATEVLTDAGHNPSLDTLRRITSTLEALSASTSLSDGPTPGRLTHDVDPPGFDSFGSFVPSAVTTTRVAKPKSLSPSKKSLAPNKTQQKTAVEASRREARQARINVAKASLQNAKKALTVAQAQAKSLEAAQKRAEGAAKEAENQKRQAEERLKKTNAASADAIQRAQSIAAELAAAAETLDDARRAVEKATSELEASFSEPPE